MMRSGARRPGGLASAPGLLGVFACLSGMSVAAEPPASAEGRAALGFATVDARLTPARVDPGGEGSLEVVLVPAEGFEWHEAPLVPSRVDVYAPAGWEAEPAELVLPAAGAPAGARVFEVRIRAGPVAVGRRKLDIELRYGVRRVATDASDGGKVYFEDVRLEVELPGEILDPAEEVVALGPLLVRPAARRAREPDERGGSPVLPALFFALASVLVLAGVGVALRRARRRD